MERYIKYLLDRKFCLECDVTRGFFDWGIILNSMLKRVTQTD